MPSTLKPQNTPLISSLTTPKIKNKARLSVGKQLPCPGKRCKQRRREARKQGQPHLGKFKLKLVTDAVMVSCVNSIDWVADSLGSLHTRTINPAAVSPATLLNSWQCNYPVWRQGVGVCQTQLAAFRTLLDNAFHRRAQATTRGDRSCLEPLRPTLPLPLEKSHCPWLNNCILKCY